MSDRPPSDIAEAPDKNRHEPWCKKPQPVYDHDKGEECCENCGARLSDFDPADTVGLPPDVLRIYHRMKTQVEKFKIRVMTFQPYKCVGTKERGKGCGGPVFWSKHGPVPKWCPNCLRRLNREKLKKWRLKKPEKWRKIRERSEARKSPEKWRVFCEKEKNRSKAISSRPTGTSVIPTVG